MEKNVYDEFAEKRIQEIIKEMVQLRKDERLSIREVSEMINQKSHTFMWRIETQEQANPRLDIVLKILAVYGYTLTVSKIEDGSNHAG